MRALRVVGITEGGGELSVVLEDPARQERFTVPADEQLRAAARGDLTRLGQIAIELESQLRPREIQARIRAGASVDQVAAAAGVPAQKIERFAYPVLLERSRTAEVAQRAHPIRADGPDSRMLADVVAHTFGLRGQEYPSAEWDSWKGDDGRWVVALSWRAGRSDNRALWTFQPGAHGGTVTAIDEHAHDLVEGLPARPLRTVGPVIDISRPDEQPPACARRGARAARRSLGHRGAPGRLRLVARGPRATPPGAAATGRAPRVPRRPAPRPLPPIRPGRRARHRMARSPAATRGAWVGPLRRRRCARRASGARRRRPRGPPTPGRHDGVRPTTRLRAGATRLRQPSPMSRATRRNRPPPEHMTPTRSARRRQQAPITQLTLCLRPAARPLLPRSWLLTTRPVPRAPRQPARTAQPPRARPRPPSEPTTEPGRTGWMTGFPQARRSPKPPRPRPPCRARGRRRPGRPGRPGRPSAGRASAEQAEPEPEPAGAVAAAPDAVAAAPDAVIAAPDADDTAKPDHPSHRAARTPSGRVHTAGAEAHPQGQARHALLGRGAPRGAQPALHRTAARRQPG